MKTHPWLALLLAGAAYAQAPSEKPEGTPPAWPELSKAEQKSVGKACQALRRAKKPERREKVEADLVAFGAGACPFVLDRLSDHKTNVNDSLGRVLDQLTEPRHADLLAARVTDRKVAVRHYVVTRLTTLAKPELAEMFRGAREDKSEAVAQQAAFGLAACGATDSLAQLLQLANQSWDEHQAQLALALPAARGTEATDLVLGAVANADLPEQATALKLLRYLATSESAKAIAPYLDSEDSHVKREAINALRVVVNGEPPLETLSVFDAIERANKWKARLQ